MRNLIFVMVLLVVLVGYGFAEEKKVEAPKATPKVAAPAETKSGRTFTDDDFVEYWAQITYLGEKFEKDPARYTQEISKLYEKLGLTTEDEGRTFAEGYGEWMANWQKRMLADVAAGSDKAVKEWETLTKKMEKRLAELKAGQ